MLKARWGLLALLALVLATAPSAAFAQGEEPTPDPDEQAKIARAQGLYDRASELYSRKQYEEAVLYYERALELISVPDIQYNIAKCYEKMAQYDKAIHHFEAYLALSLEKTGKDAPDKRDVEAIVVDLRRRSAPKQVKLTIETEPVGANVFLGDLETLAGQTPYVTELDAGTYSLLIRMEGYEEVTQQVELKRGEPQKLTFSLQRKSNVGALVFDVNVRGARLYVQGQVKGLTPYKEEILVPAGRRQVAVEKERYTTASRIIDVTAGKTHLIREDLYLEDPSYSWRGYTGWTLASLGLVGIGGGVAIKMVGDDKFFEDDPNYEDLQLYQGLSYGVGGALVGIGVGLIIWEYARDAVEPKDIIPEEERGIGLPTVGIVPTLDGGVSVMGHMAF